MSQASDLGKTEGEVADAPAWNRGRRIGNYGPVGEFIKGATDRLFAAIGLLLLSPVLLFLALAVKFDSPGPAFFRQTRIGRGGRPFTFWKFRGMYVDARTRFPELYAYRYSSDEVKNLHFHPDNDPRVTRIGQFIRRTSLDELPNLINVVFGDMSLVGPRPEIPEMIPYYGDKAVMILSVKPGITSLAKLVGRDDINFNETLEFDTRYVVERSLAMDMKLLFGTVWMVIKGKNVGH